MTSALILLCCYPLTGLALAVGGNVLFIKGGFNVLCFSPKETFLLTVSWPYFMFGALMERDY